MYSKVVKCKLVLSIYVVVLLLVISTVIYLVIIFKGIVF